VIVLYATGEGQISLGGIDGAITGTPLPSLTLPAAVRIGGLQCAGEVCGVMQVNAVVTPDALIRMVSVYRVMGNAISPANVRIWVK
jgi:uncharacterized protein (TIGR03437 family)